MTPSEFGGPVDVRLAKALSHPLRQQLLMALSGRVASPSDLADELGARLGDVSYHTRQLHEHGCLELVRTERRRGAIKHFYTASLRFELEDEQWRTLPPSARRRLAGEVLTEIWRDVSRASQDDRLAGDSVHISRTLLQLDGTGWDELQKLLRTVVEQALEIGARSAERTGDSSDGAGAASELVILHFPTQDHPVHDPVRSAP